MRKPLLVLALLAMSMLSAKNLQAQFHFGPLVAWGDDADFGLGGRVTFGIHLSVDSTPAPLELQGEFVYFFPDGPVNYWEINTNAAYLFPGVKGPVGPYAGAGLDIANASGAGASNTDVGLNLLGGVKFRMSRITPFAEVRVELGGGEQFVIAGGVYF